MDLINRGTNYYLLQEKLKKLIHKFEISETLQKKKS